MNRSKPPARASSGLAFACPDCRVPLAVEAMRSDEPASRLRARCCLRCGHLVLTREVPVFGRELLAARPLAGVPENPFCRMDYRALRRGFVCRWHLRPLDITHVRPAGRGIVVRYLQCPACGPVRRRRSGPQRRGPLREGETPMVRTEERSVRTGDCATTMTILTELCQSG